MRKIEPEFITGMGYIGASPGVLYRMGGAGEQTVVTGNPVLLENVKGNRFTSLTLHGKSTQESTTGAQLFDASLLKNTSSASVECNDSDIIITALEDGSYRQTSSVPIGFFEEGDQICIAAEAFPKDNVVIIRDSSNATIANVIISNGVQEVVTIPANGTYRIILCINKGVSVKAGTVGVVSKLIVNKGNVSKDYEPYTGGKPSPSAEYPKEIKSAGQDGEIGVEVLSGNLFDKSAAYDLTQSGGWSASFDGEELKVVGNNITIGSIRLFNYKKTLPAGTYTFSISKPLPFEIRIDNYFLIKKGDTSATVTFDNGVSMSHFAVDAEPGATFNEQRFKIMLNAGSTALPYELYKPAQTLIIPTPNGLPGIRVSSGGNYTDADGQQWVCDEVDFKKGVYVQRIGKRTITSKDAFHKSGMSTDDVNYFSLGNFSLHIGTIGEKDVLMSNCFVAGINHGFGAWGEIFLSSAFDGKVYFSVEAQKYPDEETFKQWAVENGLMFLYQLVDIIETPLAAEELSAYKTLRTYSPTTTVANDAGAGMSVGYRRK